jgi:hypothetical protein
MQQICSSPQVALAVMFRRNTLPQFYAVVFLAASI